jgi:penicillin-binding protein 1C
VRKEAVGQGREGQARAGRSIPRRPPLLLALLGFIPTLAAAALFWFSLPSPLFSPGYSTILLDRKGRLLSASIADDGQWRFPGDGEIPDRFVTALLAREDKRFFHHPGVDPIAVARALAANARAGEVVSGGSTITMQVIRLSRPGRPRTIAEKLLEALLALRLEMATGKAGILRLFASNAPFGGNVVGFEAASWRYFGREPRSLSWAECALLAVLPNSPGLIHPGRNREELLARRDRLLAALHREGAIDADALRLSLAEPLPPSPFPLPRDAPHLLDGARGRAGAGAQPGARITTTLDRSLQLRVNDILLRRAERWRESGIANAAVLVLDVETGDPLAYAGNVPGEGPGSAVDIIRSVRSTGSLLKPFLYASMLDYGELLPEQLVADIPTRIGGFQPENSAKTYGGAVPANVALAHSLNVPAVRLLRAHGLDRFAEELRGLGLSSLNRPAASYGLTLVLGGAEGSPWDLTHMYAGLARRARGLPGFAIGPGACWLTLSALLEVERPGEEGAWRDYLGSKRIAWKTGTSYGFRDAWAIGVTPRYAVGVWVGNASGEGRPDIRGSAVAAPVLFDVFGILGDSGWFRAPEADLVMLTTCAKSGLKAGRFCERTKEILAPPAASQAETCGYCRLVHLEASGRYRATTRTQPMGSLKAVSWFVLPPAMEWYYARSHSDYRPLPPFRPGSGERESDRSTPNLSLIFPEQGGKIYVPIELDGRPGRTVFHAAHRNPRATIFWHMDGQYLGETTELHDREARPGPGAHTLTLVDETGEELVRTFTCLSEK